MLSFYTKLKIIVFGHKRVFITLKKDLTPPKQQNQVVAAIFRHNACYTEM